MASWINGKKPAPSSDSAAYVEWEKDNCLVQSWLLNSLTKPVRALFEHGATAYDIWEAARKTYTMTQNIYDFLERLDPLYDGVRSRILALSPVLPPLEAYAMVMEEDTRQSAMLEGGSMALKVDPARQRPAPQHDATGRPLSRKFSPSAGLRPVGSTPSSLDGPPKCHHCNGNHYSEKCFKEHGYPDWFADYKARMYGPKAACTMTQDETRPLAPSTNLCASDTMLGMGSNTWIIATGASDHMTYDDNMFDELSRNPRDPYITSANGLPSPVTGEGSQDSREDWACFMQVLKYFELITENGVSERKNLARSLMMDMSVPHHLWGHGV
ncbi:unnamed protein product [Prunus brigantina]